MAEHPAETLRRAASLLREASGEATPGPWRVSFIDGGLPVIDGPGPESHLIAEAFRCANPEHKARQKADAGLIVLLRNSAESLAGWLEQEAVLADRFTATDPYGRSRRCQQCAGTLGRDCKCWDGALATARAILGEENDAATAAGQAAGQKED